MSPAPVALTARVRGKGIRWLTAPTAGIPAGIPKEMHLPNSRGETGRVENAKGRRGGRVVEGARLESVFTGDRNAGSNPALSASFQRTLRSSLHFQ